MTVSGLTKERTSAQPLHVRHKRNPEQSVGGSQAWPRRGALEDGQLVPQREILEDQGAAGCEHTEEACEDEGGHAGIIDQTGRQFNVDEADGVNRRHGVGAVSRV